MPVVQCPECAKNITLPFPWKIPTYTCPHCSHVVSGRRSRALHLRYFSVGLTAETADEMKRIVPVVNAALGTRLSREQFFELAVAALVEKYAARAAKSDDTAETAALTQRIRPIAGTAAGAPNAVPVTGASWVRPPHVPSE
ncbi:hypothetical protein [Frigoriglobus tundricola]|uniref:Uncharacterized protein n=1 Tax=Frigoriglobus tundricola TaxID=2774151 RepID=A0A6M5YRG4_9BACT|nr:hypothetical protein [Frigoriglobus tundricola]QJW96568.1 hypothetical protein FTUN_4125 [Frigoriglobus tundricola]